MLVFFTLQSYCLKTPKVKKKAEKICKTPIF